MNKDKEGFFLKQFEICVFLVVGKYEAGKLKKFCQRLVP